MMEAGVVLGLDGQPIHWHVPPERSGGSLPDSRDLWDIFWENRKQVSGFAHSHPGAGLPGPSHTDVTTFAAIEAALGRRLDWFIISYDSFALFRWKGPDKLTYEPHWSVFSCPEQPILTGEPEWIHRLRELSGYVDPMDISAKDGSGTPRQQALLAQQIRAAVDEDILQELERKGTES